MAKPSSLSNASFSRVRKVTNSVASTTLWRVTAAVVWAEVAMRSAMTARTPAKGVTTSAPSARGEGWAEGAPPSPRSRGEGWGEGGCAPFAFPFG